MSTSVVTSLKLPSELRDRVRVVAEKGQRKPHYVMLKAIEQYVIREEKRQSAWDEAMDAYKNYQATGLHATEQEMEAWFDKLEAGANAEPPACHP